MQSGHGKFWLLTCSVPSHRQSQEIMSCLSWQITSHTGATPFRYQMVGLQLSRKPWMSGSLPTWVWDTKEDPLRPGSAVSVWVVSGLLRALGLWKDWDQAVSTPRKLGGRKVEPDIGNSLPALLIDDEHEEGILKQQIMLFIEPHTF